MIAVVADDFSGAAELAGIGFGFGLSSEVHTEFEQDGPADLAAIDTDSRCRPEAEAARRVADAANRLHERRPDWVFKKVDSVLRGHVLAEVRSMLAATGKRRAILVPANPSRGRILREGRYFIDGRPIHQTPFAADPDYPARSSDVLDLLGARTSPEVRLQRPGDGLPESGVIVGEAAAPSDLTAWAERIDPTTLAAGAADFFAALLTAQGLRPCPPQPADHETACPHTTLFVCGSAAAWASARREECVKHGIPIVRVEPAPFGPEAWPPQTRRQADAALDALDRTGVAMLTLGGPPCRHGYPRLRRVKPCHPPLDPLVEVIDDLLSRRNVERLFVEGGGTASALVRRLGWTQTSICRPYVPGVVAMRIPARPGTILTVKPGTYPWPDDVWPTPLSPRDVRSPP